MLVATLALGCVTVSGCTTPGTASASPTSTTGSPPGPAASPEPTEPLLTTDTDTSSAVGTLAEGFPSDLVVVPDGAEVLVSSARPPDATGLREISLNLRSALDAAALVEAIRAPLLAAGFVETGGVTEPGLAAQTTLSRTEGQELLIIGVLDRDGLRTLTLGGRVRATP